ncbi:hypothetical protein FS749_004339 [Ceratobasidium sp. UAMH 11750]|nr:hypothetical protein FS749_004339 [Ceratobasidium sp. UAMH 11750]
MSAPFTSLTPELFDLALGFLPTSEVARSLTVNKSFFHNGIGHVWRHLPGTHPLFSVLLRAPISGLKPRSIPDPIPEDLEARFKLYAACVREFHGDNAAAIFSPRWLGVERLMSNKPVAPHVQTIRIGWDPVFLPPVSPPTTLSLLLGPSTTSLRLARNGCALTMVDAAQVVRRALDSRSPLTDLVLFTEPLANDEPSSVFLESLPRLSTLSTIGLSTSLLTPRLLDVLRRLPMLRALSFDGATPVAGVGLERWGNSPNSEERDGEGFPAIEQLTLRQVGLRDILGMLQANASILRSLAKLEVRLLRPYTAPYTNAEVRSLFDLISGGCPRLADLTFALPGGREVFLMQEATFAPLTSIDLERLALWSIRLTSAVDSSALHDHWPRLTHLVMPDQPAVPKDCLRFSERRMLLLLQLDFKILPQTLDAAVATMGDDHPTSPARVQLSSDHWTPRADDLWAGKIASTRCNVILFPEAVGSAQNLSEAVRAVQVRVREPS